MVVDYFLGVLEKTVNDMAAGFEAAVPRLISAVVFVLLAYAGIRIALAILRRFLDGVIADREALVVQLFVTVVGIFLWFGAGLATLKIAGLGEIAASLGTAVGFIALGVSYALSEMIEDTVAGVYLLRDPDFEVGDRVEVAGIVGSVEAIELRKSRFERENGDTTVLANRDVESKWTKRAD
ncbi:mechanosensitive ion channel domain-containing protein [Natronomonas marina]|jgi:small-conductance mechanosensitive channel|uniref:mechanosensitive ion channel domain-containing protein n=1 Tax=Natronomonas marina TaxID=2961939 RepID=UPI0020C9C6EA|nr:mechanosensitive ion channel domain-containing protein [Natronomonas marina]